MIGIEGFYNSLLVATFGGVPFFVIDTSQETGRRVQRFMFPGIDDAAFQDLGADDGPLCLRGLLVGTDYISQVEALRAVFRSAGPYQLVHPWLGTMQVVLAQRPRITLSARELQVARFEVQLYEYKRSSQTIDPNTLTKLQTRLTQLSADAQNWMAAAMAPVANGAAAFSFVQSWLTNVVTIFGNAVQLTASAGEIGPAVGGTLSGMTNAIGAPVTSFPATASGSLTAMLAAFSGSATPAQPSAVAPGGSSTAAAAADPADVVTALLSTQAPVAALGGANAVAPAPALSAAMQAAVAGAAVQAASNINYASQQDALAQQATLNKAIDQAVAAAMVQAPADPLNVTPVYRDLIALKSALAADMNALIGRLPAVVVITTRNTVPVWLLAQYVSGDTPGNVVDTYMDIVARNNVRHPAMLAPGAIEVLNS